MGNCIIDKNWCEDVFKTSIFQGWIQKSIGGGCLLCECECVCVRDLVCRCVNWTMNTDMFSIKFTLLIGTKHALQCKLCDN